MLISYRLKNKHVLILGSGKEGPGRIMRSLESEANVTYISTQTPIGFEFPHPRCFWVQKDFDPKYLDGEDLIFGAVDMILSCFDDPAMSRFIFELCRAKRIPVNCADMPEYCDFYFITHFKDGPLEIGISSNGEAPRLAVRLKNMIQEIVPVGMGDAIRNIGLLRNRIKEHDPNSQAGKKRMKWMSAFCDTMPIEYLSSLKEEEDFDRLINDYDANVIQEPVVLSSANKTHGPLVRAYKSVVRIPVIMTSFVYSIMIWPFSFYQNLFTPPPPRALGRSVAYDSENNIMMVTGSVPPQRSIFDKFTSLSGQALVFGLQIIQKPLSMVYTSKKKRGRAILVGAGPGDPELLTVKAIEAIKQADIVISDQLVAPEIIKAVENMIGKRKLTFVSKKFNGRSDSSQDASNKLALNYLTKGKIVVRLKVGDPFLYGRGGEEMIYFKEQGFQVDVVPGLPSCLAGPTAAGIPVTHRGAADSILILSGRGQNGAFPEIPEYQEGRTTIFLMGLKRSRELGQLLIEAGYPSDLGCGILEKGTWKSGQRWTKLKIQDLETIDPSFFESPSLLLIGSTVDLF